MGNPGLIHLAENICDYLDDGDLVKIYGLSKTCQSFIDVNYGRKRLIQKLDSILARKDYYPTPKTVLECCPEWKEICNSMKANASFPALKLFVDKLYKCLIRLWGLHHVYGHGTDQIPLESMIRMLDCKFVKLLVTYGLDINAKKYGQYNQTIFHCMVEYYWIDHLQGRPPGTEIIDFLFDNIERFKIDVHARDDNGRTPFDLLVERYGSDLKE